MLSELLCWVISWLDKPLYQPLRSLFLESLTKVESSRLIMSIQLTFHRWMHLLCFPLSLFSFAVILCLLCRHILLWIMSLHLRAILILLFFQFIYNPPLFYLKQRRPLVRERICLLIILQKSEFVFCCYTTLCCLLIIEL